MVDGSQRTHKAKLPKPKRTESLPPVSAGETEATVSKRFPTLRRTREIERIAALLGQPPADVSVLPLVEDHTQGGPTQSKLPAGSQQNQTTKNVSGFISKNRNQPTQETSQLIECLLAMLERAGTSRLQGLHELQRLFAAPKPDGVAACNAFVQQQGVQLVMQILRCDEELTKQVATSLLKSVVEHGNQEKIMACTAWNISLLRLLTSSSNMETRTAAASLVSVMKPTKECRPMVDHLIPMLRAEMQKGREAAVQALVTLSKHTECVTAMESGAHIEALQHHFEANTCEGVRIGCSQIIPTLVKSARAKMIIIGHDGVSVLMAYLASGIPISIVHNSMITIQALSFDSRGLRVMKNHGVLDRLAEVVRSQPGDFSSETKHKAIQTMTIMNKNLEMAQSTTVAAVRPISSLTQPQDIQGLSRLLSKLGTVFLSRVVRRVCRAWRAAATLPLPWRALHLSNATFLTDERLQILLKHAPLVQVREATMCNAIHLSSDSMTQFMDSLGGVEYIHIGDCPTLTDAALLRVMKGSEGLSRVDLSGCAALTNQTVFSIAWYLKSTLTELVLHRCAWLADDAVLLISGACRGLRRLGLSECRRLSQNAVSGVKFCSALEDLDISLNAFVTDEVLRRLVEALPHLTALDLSACENVSDAGVLHVAQLRGLEAVDLSSNMTLTDEAVGALAHGCPALKSLRCMLVPALGNWTMQQLGTGCRNLRVLDVSYAPLVGDIGLRMVLRCCPLMAELLLAWCEGLSPKGLRYVAEFAHALEVLNLSRCALDDEVLLAIALACRKLRAATFVQCDRLSPPGVAAFLDAADRSALRELDLRGTVAETRSSASRKLFRLFARNRHVRILSGPA